MLKYLHDSNLPHPAGGFKAAMSFLQMCSWYAFETRTMCKVELGPRSAGSSAGSQMAFTRQELLREATAWNGELWPA